MCYNKENNIGFSVFPSFKLHFYKRQSENPDIKGIVIKVIYAPNKGYQSFMYLLLK